MTFPDIRSERWTDNERNPIVGYFHGEKNRYAIGDPQILTPDDYDGKWHMFYHGFFDDYIPYLYHVVSDDGINWQFRKRWQLNVGPVYLFKDNGRFILYSSEVTWRAVKEEGKPKDCYGKGTAYIIRARVSTDLEEWSEPVDIIKPEYDWETTGPEACVRNPCMVRLPDGKYRLYYSGGSVLLKVCGYPEPYAIGYAESDSPLTGFVKREEPILLPDEGIPHRNFGCGGFKVFSWQDKYLALYNPIYIDNEDMPRSAIAAMISDDGIHFEEYPHNPIIAPAKEGWKKALVYQLDCVTYDGKVRLYYNARDEWLDGIERIGLSEISDPDLLIRKML